MCFLFHQLIILPYPPKYKSIWFSYGILGQPLQMLTVFISTGIMGYLQALAFVKSSSILLPFALHLGYNFSSMILFSREKSIGLQLLVKTYDTDPVKPEGILPLMIVYGLLYWISGVMFYLSQVHQTEF